MTYQQLSVLVEETDFHAEVHADSTAAHLSSSFFSAAVDAATTDSEVAAADVAVTTAVSGSSFSCYAAADAVATTTVDADAADAVTTADAANFSNAVTSAITTRRPYLIKIS